MFLFPLFVFLSLFTVSQSCTGISNKFNWIATNLNTFKIDTSQPNHSITVPLHSTFFIQIPGNPTTGFVWTQVSPSQLASADSDYIENKHPAGMTGVGGCWMWQFYTNDAANYAISFVYKQPWETSAGQRVVVEVTVKGR